MWILWSKNRRKWDGARGLENPEAVGVKSRKIKGSLVQFPVWRESTYNPNMPVRQLMYAAKLYDKYIKQRKLNLYGKKLVTFYNGTEGKDDQILKLSDAFVQDGQRRKPCR